MAAPIVLCDTGGMDRKTWLAVRAHGPDGSIPFTIGGSDISVILGVNPWKSPMELWLEKKGLLTPDDSANAAQKEMGHMMEPIVAYWYSQKSGNELIEDTNLYQHAKYSFAIADLDYRFRKKGTGQIGVFDSKSTTYHKASAWADDACPYYYELQMRWYMGVTDLDIAELGCMWGFNPDNDLAIAPVTRDSGAENMIFERAEEFVASLYTNTPPTMDDVMPEVALAGLARIYQKSVSGLANVEFGSKHERPLRRIAQLQSENETLSEKIKTNEKEVAALSVRIAELMKDHEHGILELPKEKILVDYITKTSKRPDSKKLKQDYATVYEAVLKESFSRKLKVSIKPV